MYKISYQFLSILLVICLVFFFGCKKEFQLDKLKKLNWNPELAIPLVKDSITFEKALIETDQEKNFYIDESGEVSILFYYNNDAFRLRPAQLATVPPLQFSYDKVISQDEAQVIKYSNLTLPTVSYGLDLSSGNPEFIIRKLHIKKGRIIATSNISFNNEGQMKLSFPDATRNGLPVTINIGAFLKGTTTDTIDLEGIVVDLDDNPNIFNILADVVLLRGDEPVAGDQISTHFDVQISEILKFEGYLGKHTISFPEDAVKITAFHNAYVLGNLYFVDPRVSITLYNSIGVPVTVQVEVLKAHNEANNISLNIADHLGTGAWINIPSPTMQATKPVSVTMNYDNGNTGNSIHELFNLKPHKVYFKINTTINPNGLTNNFFADTSSIFADLRVQLPLYGHFDHLTLQDTFDFALNKRNEIEWMELKTKITNGLPLTALMQVYFTDSAYNPVDSLTGNDHIFIREAPVDPTTSLPYPGQTGIKDTSFFLDQSRMIKLEKADKILVRAVMHSAKNGIPNVKIKASHALAVDFRALLKMKQTLDPGQK